MSGKNILFTPERLLENLQRFPVPSTYWVAFSGGADSTALLLALHELGAGAGAPLRALHVNHGLHPRSDDWQEHCKSFCRARGISLNCEAISVDRRSGKGLEAEARRRRYAVAGEVLEPNDFLLTAHHAGDQAETLLLNLMRGSGIDGLAGMPAMRALGKGWLVRPLLPFDRDALTTYLADRGTSWIEDASNADESYDRNFLRHSLMPILEQRWHCAAHKIAQSAAHCREAAGVLSAKADNLLVKALAQPRVLKLDRLPERDPALFKLAIRHWLRACRASAMPARQLEELCRQCNQATRENHVKLAWDGWVMQLYQHFLWLQPRESIARCPDLPWDTPGPLDLGPVIGHLEVLPRSAGVPPGLRVGSRRGGEKLRCHPSAYRKSIKQLLQEASVPPWLREAVPLLSIDDETVALGDWAIAPRLQAWLSRHDARLQWLPAEPLLSYVHSNCAAAAPVDPPGPLG